MGISGNTVNKEDAGKVGRHQIHWPEQALEFPPTIPICAPHWEGRCVLAPLSSLIGKPQCALLLGDSELRMQTDVNIFFSCLLVTDYKLFTWLGKNSETLMALNHLLYWVVAVLKY